MTRALSIAAFGPGFLIISPNFRRTLGDSFERGARGLDQNSPWSYVAIALLIVLSLMFCMSRASAPR